jgi:hypothetical protein
LQVVHTIYFGPKKLAVKTIVVLNYSADGFLIR